MEICRAKPSLHKIYLAEVGDNIEDAEPDRLETGDKEHLNEENQKREYLDYNEISKRLNQIRLYQERNSRKNKSRKRKFMTKIM